MGKDYHYLVSGLPELVFDSEINAFGFLQCKNFVLEHVGVPEQLLINTLFYPIDNYNLLNTLFYKEAAWEEGGSFSYTELTDEHFLTKQSSYFAPFWHWWTQINLTKEPFKQQEVEHKLLSLLYTNAAQNKNGFINKWFQFDCEVRNIQAVHAARKLKVDYQDYLIGSGFVVDFYRTKPLKDTDLINELAYAPELFKLLEIPNLLERENKLDLFKWQQIEHMNTFEYFSFDVVLAFLQHAYIINRWMKFDYTKGQKQFKQLIADLKGNYLKV